MGGDDRGLLLGYFALSNGIYWTYRGALIIRSIIWIAALLVTLKATTLMEAQQMSALVVVPFVMLLYAQIGPRSSWEQILMNMLERRRT